MPKSNFKIDEIVLVLIVAVLAMFVSIIDRNNQGGTIEAEKITNVILDGHSISFANNGVVDEAKLNQLKSMDYYDLKNIFKVRNDFCIYIEDENGNVFLAKGSPKLSSDGITCRE